MSFLNIFGGQTIQPAIVSYLNLNSTIFDENLTLSWPSQFQDTEYVVASTIDVSASTSGLSLTMPDATQTSVGQFVTFNNYGLFAVSIKDNSGSVITNINAGNVFYIYLIDNTTVAGTWRVIPFGTGGGGVVTSVGAVSLTTSALTITGSPIISSGTFEFTIGSDLVSLSNFASGTGISVRTGVGTWGLRSLIEGTGITIINPDGVTGNPQISVDTNLNLIDLTVGNLNLTGNILSSTSGPININPASGQNLTLGSNVSPITIDSSNNMTGISSLVANEVTAISTLSLGYPANALSNTSGTVLRAWAVFTNTGTILNSFNVSSITRISTGLYNMNYTNSAPYTNYFGTASAQLGGSPLLAQPGTTTTTHLTIEVVDLTGTPQDSFVYAAATW